MSRSISSTRRLIALLVAVVILPCIACHTGLALGVKPIGKHDFKRQVEALEEQWRTAQLNGDIPSMDRLLSADYLGITMNGQVNTKEQQLDRLRRHLFQVSRLDLADMKVKLLGQVAIVTSLASVDGMNNGKPVSGNFRYTRVYRHMASGGWQITNFEATRLSRRSNARSLISLNDNSNETPHDHH